ncbi:MAG: hypothetical protein FJ218_10615 [Ignavibacteria bacterium]|nr:hypothetical protein [Ignavibacteria bacterium]
MNYDCLLTDNEENSFCEHQRDLRETISRRLRKLSQRKSLKHTFFRKLALFALMYVGLYSPQVFAQDSSKQNSNHFSRLWSIDANNISPDLKMKMDLHPIPIIEESKLRIPISTYIVGASAIISGGIAASAKLHSDKLYKEYLNEYYSTGNINAKKRNDVRKFDTLSSITLFAAEIGFVYVAYSLLNY